MKSMDKPERKERNLLISDSITESSVGKIIEKIFEINEDDNRKEEIYREWPRDPIYLFVNSHGGSVYNGLALVDVIKQSKTPVYTVSIGACMSMGLWIWLAGKKRLIGENATLLFHDLSTLAYDKSEGIKQELSEMLRLQEMLIQEIVSKSAVKKETLEDYITRKADWYIPAKEALDLKLADSYYK